jgi:hypothetical protein
MSPKFQLDGIDIKKTTVHLGIYLLGAAIAYMAPLLANIHLTAGTHDLTPLLALVLGYLLDVGRKFVADNTQLPSTPLPPQ